jgi:hypothetical protein
LKGLVSIRKVEKIYGLRISKGVREGMWFRVEKEEITGKKN